MFQILLFSIAIVLTSLSPSFSEEPALQNEMYAKDYIKPVIAMKAQPFPLHDVCLLDSPFKTAMERHRDYLLALEPDRFLHNFRIDAGLPSTAEPLAGWENPGSEVRGHLTGHYLSACALMYASSGDKRFKERAEYMVQELAKCQNALGESGYLSAFPETFIDRVETTGKVWAPYYTLHKILAGLLDVHTLCGSSQALDVATKMGDWFVARNDRLSDEAVQKMLSVEHGGINETLANLYGLTGEEKYLRTARRLCHKAVLDPLAAGVDQLAGLHANTQFPKVIGAARLYELTGDTRDRDIAEFFWDRVVNHHSYVTGGNSDHEAFGPADELYAHVSPFTTETCNTYNMLKLTRHLFSWDASVELADYYERALYNHILASQDPRTGCMAYHVPLYGGWFMPYNTPNKSAWCCTGTGFENHAKYADSIYWQDDQGLFINLFIPSELNWKAKSIVLRQETRYPDEDTIRFEFQCGSPCNAAIRIRYPNWAVQGMTIKINGNSIKHDGKPGSFVTLSRTWSSGDRIDVRIPFSLRLEPMPDNSARAAICYGPVVLAGELGTGGIEPPMPYAISQGDYFKTKPPAMPVLVTNNRPVEDWLKPVSDKPLTFRTQNVGQPKDSTFTAFYAMTPQRFSIYWDLLTDDEWQERQAEEKRIEQQTMLLDKRTFDSIKIGDTESERAHNLQGKNTNSGIFSNRPYRDAGNGGWISYDMKVPPNRPARLFCTYWGGDGGSRNFDIIIDKTRIATQALNQNQPGEFFNVEYDIPKDTITAPNKVTITFKAHPGQMAGGLYDLRILDIDRK